MLTLLLSKALAQDAVSLSVVKVGQIGTSIPSLTINTHLEATNLTVEFTCGSKKFSRTGPAALGAQIKFDLELPVGTYSCKGAITGSFTDGTEGEMPLSFGVSMLAALKVSLVALDVEGGSVSVSLDRKASKVEVTATTLGGGVVASGEVTTPSGAGTTIRVPWSKIGEGEVIRVFIRAFDSDGFWSDMELFPWSYKVPHEEVNFATNSAEINPVEERKLYDALARVQETLRKYGQDLVTINLYVAGHTDTMGDPSSNRELSNRRALAIAQWFKDHDFPGGIYYQGFGESDPLVATGDSVDEPKNRRVDYVMASQSPGGGWQKL